MARSRRHRMGLGLRSRPIDFGLRLWGRTIDMHQQSRPFGLGLRLGLWLRSRSIDASRLSRHVGGAGFVSRGILLTVRCCGCSGTRFALGLASTVRSGLGATCNCGGIWSLPSSALGRAAIGDMGSLAGRCEAICRLSGRLRCRGLQLLPLLAESLHILSVLRRLLSLQPIDRLEPERTFAGF